MLKNYGLRKSDFILKENSKVGKLDQNYNKKKIYYLIIIKKNIYLH